LHDIDTEDLYDKLDVIELEMTRHGSFRDGLHDTDNEDSYEHLEGTEFPMAGHGSSRDGLHDTDNEDGYTKLEGTEIEMTDSDRMKIANPVYYTMYPEHMET